MKRFTKLLTAVNVTLVMALGVTLTVATPAAAWSNPGTIGCLGGTVKASRDVYVYSQLIGTLRLYSNCGGYYALFKTNGVARSLGVKIWNNCGHSAWRWMDNKYQVWTDLIWPCGYRWAEVNYNGSWYGFVYDDRNP